MRYVITGYFETDRDLSKWEVEDMTNMLDDVLLSPHINGERVSWERCDYEVKVSEA